MKSFDLGFYVVPQPGLLEKQFETLAAIDLRHCGTDGFCEWHDNTFTTRIASIIGTFGMEVHSFHAPFGLMFPRREDLDRSLDDNRRIIDVAASWGAKNIVWHTRWFRSYDGDTHFADTTVMDELGDAAIDELMAKILPATCSHAAESGININLENLPLFKWGRNCSDILDFIRLMQLPNLGFIYDIGHAWCSGIDPAAVILEAGPLLNDTHFHDNLGLRNYDLSRTATCADIPSIDLHLPVGLGTIDWIGVIRALRRIGYRNPVIFEGPHMKGLPDEKSPEQYARSVNITLANWRACEDLATYMPDSTGV